MSDAATAERALGLKQDVDSSAAEQGDQMPAPTSQRRQGTHTCNGSRHSRCVQLQRKPQPSNSNKYDTSTGFWFYICRIDSKVYR